MVNRRFLIALLALACAPAVAAGIRVSVQPIDPIVNESFRLVFTADSKVDAEPDFSELRSVVDVIGRNRQTSIQWINGRNSSTTTWVLDVLVRTAGDVTIPAVRFGRDRSPPMTVSVRAVAAGGVADDAGLLLEIEVDNDAPYVQEQVILTARLLRRVELNDANLTDPATDADAIIKRLGKDSTYQTLRGQKRYEVFERRYAVFPQTSGTMTIDPLVLTTQIVQSARSLFDPFRQSVKTRRVESNAIALDVQPIPAGYTGSTWLPARRLSLRDDWSPDAAEITAGEPLTRTVFLWADGLNAGQLPEIAMPLPDGLKSYPDQAQTSEQQTEDGFTAIRQRKYAIIASESAEIVFPAITVQWWNTATDTPEVARLAERRLVVRAPPTRGPAATPAPSPAPAAQTAATPAPAVPARVFGAGLPLLTAIGFAGWLLTAIAWWWRARRRPLIEDSGSGAADTLSRARRDVIGACRAADARGVRQALVAWGRLAFTRPALGTLGELGTLVGEPLKDEIRLLDAALYGPRDAAWDPAALREAFEHGAPAVRDAPRRTRDALPDLFRISA